ncbi:MAG: zinc ribbon domain-containing protein, partial [Ignavibacteriae bacterium]|nr:zinc ribbon domain-containing protein [Ignavibacteriota bacterium]
NNMKTGEILITIENGDIHSLIKEYLGFQPNLISPFANIIQDGTSPSKHAEKLKAISGNPDVVTCFKILCNPSVTYRVRNGGPATPLSEMYICTDDYHSFVLASKFNENEYGIQYCDTNVQLTDFLSTFLLMDNDNEYEPLFPETMDYEFFILLANILDSYKYAVSRNALKHEASSTPALTAAEFNMLLQDSLSKPDFSWLVTNITGLLPSAFIYKLEGKEKNYLDLFEKGFLLAVKNNDTGEESLMLNALSIEAGAEFMNTWMKSAGIEISTLSDNVLETKPLAFICSTALTNHCFNFSKTDGCIQYETLNNINSLSAIEKIFDTSHILKSNVKKDSQSVPLFCDNCGAKLKQGASFCVTCGNKI